MAELWAAGVRGTALDVVSAWKEVLLAVALVLVAAGARRLPFRRPPADWLALAYGALRRRSTRCCRRAGSTATRRTTASLLGLRHELVAGRGLLPRPRPRADPCASFGALGATILATAVGVAAFGLVDIYAIPLSWWRDSGRARLVHATSSASLPGPLGPARELHLQHRQRSARCAGSCRRSSRRSRARTCSWSRSSSRAAWWAPAAAARSVLWLRRRSRSLFAGAALDAFALVRTSRSRSASLVFALARPQWRLWLTGSAVLVAGVGLVFVKAYPHIAPQTTFTPHELECQRRNAHPEQGPPLPNCGYQGSAVGPLRRLEADPAAGRPAVSGIADASTESHWRSLRAGVETVLRHPQGYGLGNAGSTAARTGVTIKAGESTYTELGVETGLVGGLLFVAWSLVLLWRVLPLHRVARRLACRGARARAADGRDRRAVARLRPVAVARGVRVPARSVTAPSRSAGSRTS